MLLNYEYLKKRSFKTCNSFYVIFVCTKKDKLMSPIILSTQQ